MEIRIDREWIIQDEATYDEIVRLLGVKHALITDIAQLSDFVSGYCINEQNEVDFVSFAERQKIVDEKLPVSVPLFSTFPQALYIIRQSIPGWPGKVAAQ